MKLIDLLVQELPKQGGWPGSQYDGEVMKIDNICWSYKEGCYPTAYMNGETVRKSEYEAALAASKQPTWCGDGLPPVGTECDWLASGDHEWMRVKVLAYHEDEVWLRPLNGAQSFTVGNPDDFRPIRTEAERKRDEVIKQISHSLRANGSVTNEQLNRLYDDIAAGEIRGVKIDDL